MPVHRLRPALSRSVPATTLSAALLTAALAAVPAAPGAAATPAAAVPAATASTAIAAATTAGAVSASTVVPSLAALRYGARNPSVTWLRARLVALGWLSRTATGTAYDAATRSAVAAFQRAQGWTESGADGLMGPMTLARLSSSTATRAVDATRALLAIRVASALAGRRSTVSVAVRDERTGATWTLHPTVHYDTASIVKVQVLVTLLRRAADSHRALTASERADATRMIRYSDNDATTRLWWHVGAGPGVSAVITRLGLRSTTPGPGGYWGLTQTTAGDQALLLRAVAHGHPALAGTDPTFARSLLGSVTPSQHWGVSAGVPSGVTVQLKNGWLPRATHGWRINSVGHVQGQGRDYEIAVLSMDNATMGYGVTTVEGVSRAVWATLASPLR